MGGSKEGKNNNNLNVQPVSVKANALLKGRMLTHTVKTSSESLFRLRQTSVPCSPHLGVDGERVEQVHGQRCGGT